MPERATFIVTGGAGFIGSNLVAELSRRYPGSYTIIVDSFRTGSFSNIVHAHERKHDAPFSGKVIASTAAEVAWDKLVTRTRPNAVFHLGAITDTTHHDEREMLRENVGGFRRMLEACCGTAQRPAVPVVYASSGAVYGSPKEAKLRKAFPESAAGRPNNVYGFSKWMMEQAHARLLHVGAEASQAQLPTIVGLRYFNVFGPGEGQKGKMASMAYQLAHQMMANQRPRIFTDGSQSRDQVSVDDVVDCTIAAAGLDRKVASGVYNLGSGALTTFNQIVEALYEGLGIAPAKLPIDYFHMPDTVRKFYQDFTLADMSAAKAGLSWQPKHPPRSAMVEYAKWLRANR
ncbi:MAG: NAD-dependent epimerase/dehydratase family protein [Phycisphaerales bacterium]